MHDAHSTKLNYDELIRLLGKSTESRDYQDFAAKLPDKPRVDDLGFAAYIEYEGLGVQIRLDNKRGQITLVTVWNSNLRYGQFKGALPGGISFADDQSQVNKKLGQPLLTGTDKGLNFPPEPTDYHDRDAAYQEWLVELAKQPVSDLEWAAYSFGRYELEVVFDMSDNGKLRSISMQGADVPPCSKTAFTDTLIDHAP